MAEYTFTKYANMIIYCKVQHNGRAARRLYEERFAHRVTPLHTNFASWSTAAGNRYLHSQQGQLWCSKEALHPNFQVDKHPNHCTWHWCSSLHHQACSAWSATTPLPLPDTCKGSSWFCATLSTCTWFLHHCVEEPQFPQPILFTDVARLTREAVLNCWNSHVWADENPNATHSHGFQEKSGINVWAGIIGGHLIGPYPFPPHLMGNVYLTFMHQVLPEFLENVSLNIRQ